MQELMNENINLDNSIINNNSQSIRIEQENFLDSTFGKIINSAINIGLKSILPDLIEDEVINIKDTVFNQGIKEGLAEAIKEGINFGKSAVGIVTGNFDNIYQVEKAVEKGGILDSISSLVDLALTKAKKEDLIEGSVLGLIKQGKSTLIQTVKDKIGNDFKEQVKSLEKIESYCNKWNEHYQNQDFNKMETAYKNIEKYLNEIFPIESTINEARRIENMHNLIKNNGKNFSISEDEIRLSTELSIT